MEQIDFGMYITELSREEVIQRYINFLKTRKLKIVNICNTCGAEIHEPGDEVFCRECWLKTRIK